MNIPIELETVVTSTPDTLGGTVRFVGTRVPVQALFDTLDKGYGLDYFLEGWPDVSHDQAMSIIRWEQIMARGALGLLLSERMIDDHSCFPTFN